MLNKFFISRSHGIQKLTDVWDIYGSLNYIINVSVLIKFVVEW
jgi:hypothetical protein